MKLCIVLALIIIILLSINIYKYDLFTDYVSSNHFVLSGGIAGDTNLNFNSETLDVIRKKESGEPLTIRQSKLFSCKNDKKSIYESSSLSAEDRSRGNDFNEWFKKDDIYESDNSKIKCPNKDIYIDIDNICKKDGWYEKCDKNDSDKIKGGGFCKYLCATSDHHLRNSSKKENIRDGKGKHGWNGRHKSLDFDICKYVDKSNGRPWFSEVSDGKRKCPAVTGEDDEKQYFIDKAKICKPIKQRGMYMGSAAGAGFESDDDFEQLFYCGPPSGNNRYPYETPFKYDSSKSNWEPVDGFDQGGSDEFCCPKIQMKHLSKAFSASADGNDVPLPTPPPTYEVPILNNEFCEKIWRDKNQQSTDIGISQNLSKKDYLNKCEDESWGFHEETYYTKRGLSCSGSA